LRILDSKHKKKSMAITVTIYSLLILLLFFVGMDYLDPPPENGIAINFGTTETGSGITLPKETLRSAPKQTTPPPVIESKPEESEALVTQDVEDAPVIKKEIKPVVKEEPPVKETTIKELPKEFIPIQVPSPDKSTIDVLSNLINGPKSDAAAKLGEGNNIGVGDKGDIDAAPNALAYYGTGKGLDGDGNYQLGGRKALNKETFVQDCNESGTVVVSIEVDREGRVIRATSGVRGTTNNTRCLLEPAKRAALATRFNTDLSAPTKQIGKIVYRFSLSE
jgi:protein TonB